MADMTSAQRNLDEHARRAMVNAAHRTAVKVAQGAPFQTGRLSRSIDTGNPIQTGFGWSVEIVANTDYAGFVDDGTPPHEIRGRPILSFYWPTAGKVVFFRKVNHPGTVATDFFKKSLPDYWAEDIFDALLEEQSVGA